jgi:hypothetical protein
MKNVAVISASKPLPTVFGAGNGTTMLRMLALLTPDLRFKIVFAAQFCSIVKPVAHHYIYPQ